VLLCNEIIELASTYGAKSLGGLWSSFLDARRTFCHLSTHLSKELLKLRSILGRDKCTAGLEGDGMKRTLLLDAELSEVIARLSQQCPKDERLGQRLSKAEFAGLLKGLAH
jgi:hypothetical protein